MLANESKKGMIAKILKKGTYLECNNWRGICVFSAVTGLIDTGQDGFALDHPTLTTVNR